MRRLKTHPNKPDTSSAGAEPVYTEEYRRFHALARITMLLSSENAEYLTVYADSLERRLREADAPQIRLAPVPVDADARHGQKGR